MTASKISAAEPSGPAIEQTLYVGTETQQDGIAKIEVYLPEGIPHSIKRAVEVQCINILNYISENIEIVWKEEKP